MKCQGGICLIAVMMSLFGCVSKLEPNTIQSYFNKSEFTGFLGFEKYGNIQLEGDLTKLDGDSVHIVSCAQFDTLNEDDIVDSQYNRYKLFKINCRAAKQYLSGKQAERSFFDGQLFLNIVEGLPATIVPDLGGNSLEVGKGKIISVFNFPVKVSNVSNTSVEIVLKGRMNVTYILMARRDINQDGTEDLILRMDWHVPNAFGSGSSMIALTKESAKAPVKELWRE